MKFTIYTESWLMLGIAIFFGVLGAIAMKLSNGMQKIKPMIYIILFYSISFVALTFAVNYIDLSVVYAIWSGAGTALVVTTGILFFGEKISLSKLFFITLIIIGVIGMHT